MSLRKDFQDFIFRGNVVDLAVGVMIGVAFGKVVTATVSDLVMPLVSPLLPTGDWRSATWEPLPKMKILFGHFAGEVIDFVITAAVLFFVLVKFVGFLRKRTPPPPPPATKTCGDCLESVPAAAKRCKHCTSPLPAI